MWDTIVIGLSAFLYLFLSYVGLYVAVRPPEDETKRRRTLTWCFGLSALALILAVITAARAGRAQERLQGSVQHVDTNVSKILGVVSAPASTQQISAAPPAGPSAPPARSKKPPTFAFTPPNAFLQFFKVQYVTGDEFFTIGRPLQLNIYYANKGQAPVDNALSTAALSLIPRGNYSQSDMDAFVVREFEPQAKAQTDKGGTVGVDSLIWSTPALPIPLTQELVDEIMRGQEVLYVVSYARWKNLLGASKDVLDCTWLEPPQSQHPPLDSLVWHVCRR